ncbi:MAG TPA: EAL domain-containing protein [Burkholderiales bacterium]|nr:EAL domain-containing protein [Burkholderiales bacterium]
MRQAPIKLLLVEDNHADAELEVRELKRAGLRVEHRLVDTETGLRRELAEFEPELILSDFSMPRFDGMSALAVAKEIDPDIPFIFVSGTLGEDYAIRALKNGATDYVLKTNLVRLPAAVERALKEAAEQAAKRRVERELQESEAGLRRAQLMAELAHIVTGPDGVFESWSATLAPLAGVEPARMPKDTREWLQLVHPEDREHFRRTSIEAGRREMRMDLEYRLRRADGSVIHVLQAMEPITPAAPSADGGLRWFNTLQNITAQKQAAAELRLSESRYRAVFEQAAVGIVHASTDGDIQMANPKFCDMLGYSHADAVLLNLRDLADPEDVADHDGTHLSLLSGPEPQLERELRLKRKDGSLIWTNVTMSLVRAPNGEPLYCLCVFHDVTERKAQQERIARLTRVHAVLSGINSLIVRVRDRDELFEGACKIAVEAGSFLLAWIGTVDQSRTMLLLAAWDGDGEGYVQRMPVSLGEGDAAKPGLNALAVADGQARVVNDIERDPRFLLTDEALKRGFRSFVTLPLSTEGEVSGVLALYAEQPGFFDDEEMRLLNELAGDISFALAHIAQQEKLNYVALYDSLTGLANRALLSERLAQTLHGAGQAGSKVALSILDLERFRTVNESLGRQEGDALIRQVAGRLARAVGAAEVARIGADHFAVILAPVNGQPEAAKRLQDLLQRCFGEPYHAGGAELRVTAKAGIALFPNDGVDAEILLRNAEAALNSAKKTGDPRVFYTSALTDRTSEQLSLLNKLQRGLANDEFVLHYQPKFDTATRRIVGVEALIRWQSPELGLVPPARFIPLMEETGIILEAGAWALAKAVGDHSRWLELGLPAPRVAVNVSAIQLRKRDFLDTVRAAVTRGPDRPGIDLEITESLIMEDIESNIRKLKDVRDLGMEIAIDDFGTGYSSLGYLAKLPVQTLKIDRSFIITMLKDPATMTLVQTIISLAHSLKLKVVAEGVDEEDQAQLLGRLGCDEIQGFLFSRPVPFAQMTEMLARLRGDPPAA